MILDSNIIIYSINISSPKHKEAQKFIQNYRSELFVAHQNVFESLRVLTHKKFPSPMKPIDAVKSIFQITNALRIVSPNYESYYLSLEFIRKYDLKSDQVFDAYLVGTALSNDINTIATDNEKDFKVIKEINIFNPFSKSN